MNRRRALGCCAALGAGLFSALAAPSAHALSWREGFSNPCLGALPETLARHEIVLQAFEGLRVDALWDSHTHLLGNGDSGSGCSINAHMHQWWHPIEVLRRNAILDAACTTPAASSVDRAYVQRLCELAAGFPPGARWLLFAFDHACDALGQAQPQLSTFHVPNAYAAQVAAAHPDRFGWVASVHPYREDALARLDEALAQGALALKWLPSAMNIDLRDRRCRPLFDRLAQARVPLIVHAGEEKAVAGAERDELGNPLLVRHALEAGVRVVVAHAASLGQARDLDRPSAPARRAFELWARLMDEAAWRGLLFADISAVFQSNRTPAVRRAILQRDDWHPRLLHGSDYPLPGVMPLFDLDELVREDLLAANDVPTLRQLRAHNALLFDFVLKRRLRAGSARLPATVFETRAFFEQRTRAA